MTVVVHGEHQRGRRFATGDLADDGLCFDQTAAIATMFAGRHEAEQAGLVEMGEVFEGKLSRRIEMRRALGKVDGQPPRLADGIDCFLQHGLTCLSSQATARLAKASR